MSSRALKLAKAGSQSDQSNAIVVSFGYEWYEKLRKRTFSAIIRKRVPTTSKPAWLYFHINAPLSAICGRSPVVSIARASKRDAIALAGDLDLSVATIDRYMGRHDSIGLYKIGEIELARHEVAARTLNSVLVYHAPQSFFVLSNDGKKTIDSMCCFRGVACDEASRG